MVFPTAGSRFVHACRAGVAGLVVLLVLAAALARISGDAGSVFADPVDFRAFYCAGWALAAGGDPYRSEPDATCQRAVLAQAGLSPVRDVLPAPLPPYALAAFGLAARLPYRLAASLWLATLTLCAAASVFLAAALARVRPVAAAPVLLVCAGIVPLLVGQLVPLVLAAGICAALAARRGNGPGAAASVAVMSLEPHLALPVWLGLLVCAPPVRRAVLAAGAGLAAVSLSAGPDLNVEYLARVLPAHARSELFNFGEQYGLSPLLAAAGVSPATALRLGSADYALMLAAGLGIGWALVRRTGDRAFAVTAPLAYVVLGGPFLHIHQTVAAVPLGLMLLARARSGSPAFIVAAVGLLCLAVPWQLIAEAGPAAPLPPRAVAAARAVLARPVGAQTSIEEPYTAYVDALAPLAYRRSAAELAGWKLPTWLGLIALAGCALAAGLYFPRALTGTELVEPNMRSPASPRPGTM